jgi:ATP-dependent Clp protease ATP-binding subunit ClpC
MIKSVQSRLKDKDINLIVELSVQAFLTDEGYDPIYGARPLRRAIMKYLEDTLAEQCLSKTLYPNTKIHVRRKKVEGTLMTYTNELEVEIDFSDVDPTLLEKANESNAESVAALVSSEKDNTSKSISGQDVDLSDKNSNLGLGTDKPKPNKVGTNEKFFKR